MAEARIPSGEFCHRASPVRTIAEGPFDKTERQIVLLFVDDRETPFAIHERGEAIPQSPNSASDPDLGTKLDAQL